MESFRLIQCYHCLSFDHIKSNCPHKNENRICARCGDNDHPVGNCENPTACLHCKGPHPATARCCPKYLQIFKTKFQEVIKQIQNQFINSADQHQLPIISSTPFTSRSEYEESWTKIQEVAQAADSPTDFVEALYTLAKSSEREISAEKNPNSKISSLTYDIELVNSEEDIDETKECEAVKHFSPPQPTTRSSKTTTILPTQPPFAMASEESSKKIKEINSPINQNPEQPLVIISRDGVHPMFFTSTRDNSPEGSVDVVVSFVGPIAPNNDYYLRLVSSDSTEQFVFAKYPIKPTTKVYLCSPTIIWEDIERGKLTIKCSNEHSPHETDTIIKKVFDYIQSLILKASI